MGGWIIWDGLLTLLKLEFKVTHDSGILALKITKELVMRDSLNVFSCKFCPSEEFIILRVGDAEASKKLANTKQVR